ncbi:hypothetical protein HON36_02965 [Candidatus Parcubacteria bacterium]|nr:hypothetical protein [Candidatus Parcubacteria bacterium]
MRLKKKLATEAEKKLADEADQKAREIIKRQLADITPEKGEQMKRDMLNTIMRSMQNEDLDKLADEALGDEE